VQEKEREQVQKIEVENKVQTNSYLESHKLKELEIKKKQTEDIFG